MKRTITLAASAALAATLAGCVVAPVPYHGGGGPAVGVYVAPTYPIPAPGFAWTRHHVHGWGWRHPRHGWHRGWR